MRKFLAVVKREYLQRVRSRMFVFMTVLAPIVLSFFGIVPALIFRIQAGGPAKIAVVDSSGKLFQHLTQNTAKAPTPELDDPTNPNLREAVRGSATSDKTIEFQRVNMGTADLEQIKQELDRRTSAKEINGYLIVPADIGRGGKPEFVTANAGDVFTRRTLQETVNRAVRELRLEEANIDPRTIEKLSQPVELQSGAVGTAVGVRDSGERFLLVFAAGFVMYITILLYGQIILGAIIEEKETRIAEILFSSVRPFTLMIGKLVGVSLVALTQLAIWGLAFAAFVAFGVSLLAARGMPIHIPNIPPMHLVYFALFFLLGYYLYSTIYAFVGSMVTTPQEGGQLAMPIVLLLAVGFYLFLPVSRSPDSSFAFWVSMLPFFAPVTMMVRIATQTPPFWQIALSFTIGVVTILCLLWIASRIYRIGMLMYGKKASIPEVIRWVRQA